MGMKNGPHEGGNASYPVAWDRHRLKGTTVQSSMTVPALPQETDGITYYIWTDIFFGDAGMGRMNQLVPQLLLGKALDGSSGPPDFIPKWGDRHDRWSFGAHYFFEIYNNSTGEVDAHAAYGELYPVEPGEGLWTEFHLEAGGDGFDEKSPRWVLSMGVEGDADRTSTLKVDRPYMGLGEIDPSSMMDTKSNKALSWADESFHNMCINSCWELYGADDDRHLPSSGATYNVTIIQPTPGSFEFLSEWEQDEGQVGGCPSSTVKEVHNSSVQRIRWDINVHDFPLVKNDVVTAKKEISATGDSQWEHWKQQHALPNSKYHQKLFGIDLESAKEETYRRGIFTDNIKRFESRGDRYVLDQHAILTAEEFRRLGKTACASSDESAMASRYQKDSFSCTVLSPDVTGLDSSRRRRLYPQDIDYRGTQSTPPKNQGAFGTCWSFGFVEAVEGLGVRQGHYLTNTSNQEVIDCCPKCRGSAQDTSFGFVLSNRTINGRLATEDAYPYVGAAGNCSSNEVMQLAPARVGGCVRVFDDKEKTGQPILLALSILGPAAFGIDVSCFQGYAKNGGVISNCTGHGVDHEVLLVGAGIDNETGIPYFRAKNSWGQKWGEEGYFRFAQSGGQMSMGSVVFATSAMVAEGARLEDLNPVAAHL